MTAMEPAVSVRLVRSYLDKTLCDSFDMLNAVIEELACALLSYNLL